MINDLTISQGGVATVTPPRSVLAPLKPIGFGSSWRECLSSYLQRLADVYCVTPNQLCRAIFTTLLSFVQSHQVDRIWQHSNFNAMGPIPRKWSDFLGQQTSVRGLDKLTLLPLEGLACSRSLTVDNRQWCPLCFEEDEASGTPYGRLLWEIESVKACPIHEVRLISECGCTMGDALPARKRKFLPNLCWICGRNLNHHSIATLHSASSVELRHARLIADLLGCWLFEDDQERPIKSGVPTFLGNAVLNHPDRHAAGLARTLGVSKGSLHGWMTGINVPAFPRMVSIADTCEASLVEVLAGEFNGDVVKGDLSIQRSTNSRKKCNWNPRKMNKVANDLLAALRATPPPSLSSIARETGASSRIMRDMHPLLVQAISARWMDWNRARTGERRNDREATMREAAEALALEGVHVTRRQLSKKLEFKLTIFSPEEKAVCKRICEEVNNAFRD